MTADPHADLLLAMHAALRDVTDPLTGILQDHPSRALRLAGIDLLRAVSIMEIRVMAALDGVCCECGRECPSPRCYSCETAVVQDITEYVRDQRRPNRCGAPTRTTGEPCQSSVDVAGTLCHRHRPAEVITG